MGAAALEGSTRPLPGVAAAAAGTSTSTSTVPVAVRRPRAWVTALPIALVVGLGAALRLIALSRVRLDPFYDAAVRSMGLSWHNLFYGAFEPTGQVSVDKIPTDLWLQVASTKLLGFTSLALHVPEVVAGTLAIVVLYDLVRRLFGRPAGVLSAAALAVLPISVVTARSDTMDSLMMLCVVCAAWLVVRSCETGRAGRLVGAGAVMGFAFDVKLFEALVALPALLVLAVLACDWPWRQRLRRLAAAAVAFVAVSLAWLVAVSLSPAAHRPYPIGSTNGSVWNVVFAYNGIDRVGTPPSAAQLLLDPPGVLRLLRSTGVMHGRLIGSALIAALALGGAAVAVLVADRLRRGVRWTSPPTAARPRRAGAVFLALWLVLGVALFSAMGRLHPRYLEAFTPAVAATTGVSLAWLAERARRDGTARWLLVAAVAVTAVLASHVAVLTWPPAGTIALLAAGVTAAIAAVTFRRSASRAPAGALLAGAAIAVLAIPAASSLHLASAGASSSGRPGYAPPARVAALSRYLRTHQAAARYEAASGAVAMAGPLIARDGRPVLMLTSLYDRPLLTAAQLRDRVARGQVRYVLLGVDDCRRVGPRCPPVVYWARRHATDVSAAARQPAGSLFRLTLRPTR